LTDAETVRKGLVASEESWKYYDLGQHAASLNMPTLTNSLS